MVDAGYKIDAAKIFEDIAETLVREHENPSALKGYNTKTTVSDILNYLKIQLENRGIKSEKISALNKKFS